MFEFIKFYICKSLKWFKSEIGSIGAGTIVSAVVGIVVVGFLAVALFPMLITQKTAIAALTPTTDAGIAGLQSMFPIVLVVVGIGLAVGLIMMALKKFGIMKG